MATIFGNNYAKPSLDLNFARTKSLVDTMTGRNLTTFTRASTATYVGSDGLIKTAAANEPRFDHDPVTGVCKGLLVEESRTNRASYSIISTGWIVADGATITPNSELAPDGTRTASLIYFPGTGVPRVNIPTAVTSGNKILSVWIRSVNGTVTVRLGNNSDFGGIQHTIGTTWTRISYSTATGSNGAGIYCSNPVSEASFYAWGFQEEDGTFLTSYIPTSGTTVTRSADVLSITGTNFSRWYNNNEGTFLTNMALGFTVNAGNPFTFGGVYYTTVAASVRTLANATLLGGLPTSQTISSKVAIGLKPGAYSIYVNGFQNGSSTSSYVPTGTEFRINSSLGSLGFINRITYYPQRLSNTALQQLTR
jgi:hypothetical protein